MNEVLKNFAPRVQESLLSLAKVTNDKNIRDLLVSYAVGVKRAVCWSIGPDAFDLLWHTQLTPDALEQVWVPYDYMAVEYTFDYLRTGIAPDTGSDPAPNRLVLVTNGRPFGLDRFIVTPFWEMTGNGAPPELMSEWDKWQPNHWTLSPYAAIVREDSLQNVNMWNDESGYKYGPETHSPLVVPSLPLDELQEELFSVHSVRSVADEVRAVLALLAVLNTERVPVKRIPAPEKLNKKRREKGRPEIPAYSTLNISHPTEWTKSIERAQRSGWTVRPHWRRGHIRNQPYPSKHEQKKIWIRPTVVGVGECQPPTIKVT
jgi:hypothetical protein